MPRLNPRPPSNFGRVMGNRSHLGPGTNAYLVSVEGANVLADHLYVMGQVIDPFSRQLFDVLGDIGIAEARRLVRIRTGDTFMSINKSPGVIAKPERGEWSIRYGPTTFYAALLEYGTVHAQPYPFMIPSGDIVEPIFIRSIIEFVNLIDKGVMGWGVSSGGITFSNPQVRGSFTGIRSFLYDSSKALGDVSVLGGRGVFGPIRALELKLARGLGDVSAIMNRTISSRITNRLGGRVTGHIIGFGSHSLSYSKTYSAFPGGSSGHRVYQRLAGHFGPSSLNLGSAVSSVLGGNF